MAKFLESDKKKRRVVSALSILLASTLTLGIFSACTPPAEEEEDEDNTVSATDTQLLKNGNFEFYGEMDEEDEDGNKKHEKDELRAFINSPNNWSFSSGSPSSNTSSGIVNTADWDYMSKSSADLILEADKWVKAKDGEEHDDAGYKLVDGERVEAESATLTDAAVSNAESKWETASLYDRLKFYDFYSVDSASEFALYKDYKYSVDFEDLEYLAKVSAENLLYAEADGRKAEETSVLMIHNYTTLNSTAGTAQYYTSSTTVTLQAGTAAELSVWVRTSELYHYGTGENEEGVPVTARGGAYIGVTNTVGGTTLDQMQIKYINTHDTWQKYTVYIRANSFASTTFRVVLGLGHGNSDNRYEGVNGFAFFDDVSCKIITEAAYEKTAADKQLDKQSTDGLGNFCDLSSEGDEKKFFATDKTTGEKTAYDTFALDLDKMEGEGPAPLNLNEAGAEHTSELTKEVSGSRTYTSESIDKSLGKNTGDAVFGNILDVVNYDSIKTTDNNYLKYIYENDFAEDKLPEFFQSDEVKGQIVLMLSANGAALTTTISHPQFTLEAGSRKLISFFVKTSEIRSGKTGASAILVDGANKNTIAAFDSTKVATVDIEGATEEETVKDLYKGWVRCFFFVQNDTEEAKTFRLELTYGPTAISGTSKTDYADGYAAFANFEVCDLTKTQYGYAATGTYAQKVSLTASVKDSSKFAEASANGTQLEDGLAIPVGYEGVQAGSNYIVSTQKDENGEITNGNPNKEELNALGLYTGLLSSEYADKYLGNAAENPWLNELSPATLPEGDAEKKEVAANWWKSVFGNPDTAANPAYQPLVLINTSGNTLPGYGFFAASTTVAANAASRISVRVKLSQSATAYLYLADTSDVTEYDKRLAPTLPKVTYWYDDEGNIVAKDPAGDDFDEKTDILFTLEENGLYKNAVDTSDTKYYANLSSFDRDEEHNYTTTSGTIAFFHNPADTDENTAYAYYDKDTDKYTQPVSPLPADKGVRYTAPADLSGYEAVIKLQGSAENAGKWVTASFYVQAGNTTKNYRLELWAGARDADKDHLENGIAPHSYVFFDKCTTTSVSNYSTLLGATKDAMLDYKAEDGTYTFRDASDKEKVASQYGLYYTFTFFDSPDYLRYDKTEDEEKLGNPWGSYKQSEHEEALTWLFCEDMEGELLGSFPTVSLFMSYAENEVTVTPDDLGGSSSSSSGNSSSSSNDSSSNGGGANIWLLMSSILLAAALIFAIIAVGVRRLLKKNKTKSAKPKKSEGKRPKFEVSEGGEAAEAPEAPKPQKAEKPAKPVDENDPYNE